MIKYSGFRYCPSCGEKNIEVYFKNGMRCRSCGYIYFHNTASAVAAIIEIDGTVLLTVRAHKPEAGKYDLPGGFIDYGESAEEACVREIREELGIAVQVGSYLGSFANRYTYKDVIYYTNDTFFVCTPVDTTVQIVHSDEVIRWALFAPKELPFAAIGFESIKSGLHCYTKKYKDR